MNEAADPVVQDLQARVAALEGEVARLARALGAEASARTGEMPFQPPAAPAAPPHPPFPPRLPRAVRPPRPSKPFNATVLVAALGAGIFLLGAIFFLLLAIQRGWIGPELRVLLGLGVGGAFAALGGRHLLAGRRGLGVSLLLAGLGTLVFTFWAGASLYHLYPLEVGFGGAAATALLAGGLAARAKSGGALAVALVCGFLAPPIFSTGGHHEVFLGCYLLLLLGAAAAVPYLGGVGARWHATRWLFVAGQGLCLAAMAAGHRAEDAGTLAALSLAHWGLAGVWIWLPRQPEARPSSPTVLWFLTSLAATGIAAVYWERLLWPKPWFALAALGFGAVHLGLAKPLRARLNSRQADLGLMVLAAGHLALAVPIALEWKWVGPLWGAFALGLAWAAGKADTLAEWDAAERANLRRLAFGMALLASLRWAIASESLWNATSYGWSAASPAPLLHAGCAAGLMAVGAWALLARTPGAPGVLAFLAFEVMGPLVLALEAALLVRWLGEGPRAASIALTLVFALAGVAQWLSGLRLGAPMQGTGPARPSHGVHEGDAEGAWRPGGPPRPGLVGRALGVAGLVWMGLASAKLLVADMARADTALRTLAFLAVGALLMGAALLSQRARRSQEEPS